MRILTFDIEDWFHIIQEYPDDIIDKWLEDPTNEVLTAYFPHHPGVMDMSQ